jgi:cytosine deaminase
LPATDLFLSGRQADRNRPRGLAPLQQLITGGVTVAVATSNVRNAFTPYGNGSLLQIAWLAGLVVQFEPGWGHPALPEAVTTRPARLLGWKGTACRSDPGLIWSWSTRRHWAVQQVV